MIKKIGIDRLFKLMGFIKPWWPLYILGLVGVASQNLAFNFALALGLKGLTEASVSKDMNMLLHTLIMLVIRLGFLMIIIPVLGYMLDYSTNKATGNMRKTLFAHVQKLSMGYIENQHSGDLISRLTNDIQTAESAYTWQMTMVLMAVFSGVGSTLVIIGIDWRLAAVAVVLGSMNTWVNAKFMKPLKRVSDKVQEALSAATQKVSDLLAGAQVIKIFNLSGSMTEKYRAANREVRGWSMKRVILNSYLGGINGFLMMMSFVGMLAIGSIMIIRGQLDFGSLIMIIQMMNGIIFLFSSVGNFLTQMQSSLAGAERIFDVMSVSEESLDSQPSIERPSLNQLVSSRTEETRKFQSPIVYFDHVAFSYEENSAALKDLSLAVQKDEVVALVGSSGSGKSTLLKLLVGFYTPSSGEIKVMGKSLTDYSLDALRKLTAYVPQDNYLFSGSILENIQFGRLNASREDAIAAAKAANAHDFITDLPEGYETQVGERGAHLSGGQRQRIAIARAILKDAPILLLDEATSSLDSESEHQVQQALEVLMKGRSTLVVAHRLSTIRNADRIIVLENGHIIEEGDHESLMERESHYARLYNLQFKVEDSKTA